MLQLSLSSLRFEASITSAVSWCYQRQGKHEKTSKGTVDPKKDGENRTENLQLFGVGVRPCSRREDRSVECKLPFTTSYWSRTRQVLLATYLIKLGVAEVHSDFGCLYLAPQMQEVSCAQTLTQTETISFQPMAMREPSPDQSLAAPSLWSWGRLSAATWYQLPNHTHVKISCHQAKALFHGFPDFCSGIWPRPCQQTRFHPFPPLNVLMIEQQPFVLFKQLPCMKICIYSGWKCRFASMCAVWHNLRHIATSGASATCPPILPTRAQLYHPSSPSISPQPLNNHSKCATPRGSAMAMVISMVRRAPRKLRRLR